MDKVTIVKCQCNHPNCHTYGLSTGTFYQGCGWGSEAEAQYVANAINEKMERDAAIDSQCDRYDEFGSDKV